ncbi:hypothetical protein DICPUDRAFT_41822 [Dictyostelium purpureum]|uniref:J domain-containing protein n=1 Tax=Dictyostelium purpureum TaxID=5786 RepID=F1A0V5_DICPU|nr:uncharacterized protein DICPUDRAFT_41822 [Dictyostelium purpureum]EGC30171.1 hypothetical protein DICPUDRAFT_41822 [Dictyostelium purpureum]|eukprot:XP_003293297.1 hypothetical protein DICPUDRAFT_41822 [Dictyostelium purpureum]
MATKIKCYYEVLGIEKTAKQDEIKISYRKLALQWHPDKNQHQIDIAEERFKEIVNAYTILSDPNERKWYDDHRESILRGGRGGANDDGDYDDDINLWPYFNASCFTNYSDTDDNSFYNVYSRIFSAIDKEEESVDEEKYHFQPPQFGNSKTPIAEVLKFYGYWKDFVTKKKFTNADIYHLSEAPNRQIKRLMEKENQKERNRAKQQFNEKVRHLASFIYNHDKRIQEYQKKCAEEAEKKQKELEIQKLQEEEERKEAIKKHKEEKRLEYEQMKKDGLIDDYENNTLYQDESNSCYCVICDKAFKSEKQLENHQNSNKHKQELARVRKTITLDDEELSPESNNNQGSDIENDDDDDEGNTSFSNSKSNKKNKKNKKKSKKVINSNMFNSNSDEYVHGLVKNKTKKTKSKKKEESEDEVIEEEKENSDQDLASDDDEDEMLVNSLLKNFRINKNQPNNSNNNNDNDNKDNEDEDEEEEAEEKKSKKKKKQLNSEKESEKEDENSDEDDKDSDNEKKSNKKSSTTTTKEKPKKGKAKEKREKKAEKKQQQQSQQKEGESLFCNVCKGEFPTRNKLFQHIKETNHAQAVPSHGSSSKKRK